MPFTVCEYLDTATIAPPALAAPAHPAGGLGSCGAGGGGGGGGGTCGSGGGSGGSKAGHKFELRVVVYRAGDELRAFPSIAKVRGEGGGGVRIRPLQMGPGRAVRGTAWGIGRAAVLEWAGGCVQQPAGVGDGDTVSGQRVYGGYTAAPDSIPELSLSASSRAIAGMCDRSQVHVSPTVQVRHLLFCDEILSHPSPGCPTPVIPPSCARLSCGQHPVPHNDICTRYQHSTQHQLD